MTADVFRSFYVLLLALTVLICGAVAWTVWHRRQAPGASALVAMMLGQMWWSFAYALDLSSAPRPDPLFWGKLMFLGVAVGPAAFLAFALQYTGRGEWINKRMLAWLAVEPVLFIIAVWTDQYHHLVGAGYRPGEVFVGGTLFWVHTGYSYLLMNIGGALLIPRALNAPWTHRVQARLLLLGLLVIGVANAGSLLHLFPWPTLDFTPIGFTICGVINAVALVRYGLFDLGPMARHAVMERMKDGVVVLDTENRIADMNPAAQALLELDAKSVLGHPAASLPAPFGQICTDARRGDIARDVPFGSDGRYVDLQVTALNDRHRPGGWLVVLRDVTHVKRIESELRSANDRLRQKLVEIESLQAKLREQAIRDPLTDLYNRRFLKETLTLELAQATRLQTPLSVAVIDLDHFKRINDRHGHHAGDRLLEALGNLLRSRVRTSDVACRYGGEEFVVVMPGAPLAIAVQRADEWRLAFANLRVAAGTDLLVATFSAGVASFPLHGLSADTLLHVADQALYGAKAAGRNRVVAADNPSMSLQTSE